MKTLVNLNHKPCKASMVVLMGVLFCNNLQSQTENSPTKTDLGGYEGLFIVSAILIVSIIAYIITNHVIKQKDMDEPKSMRHFQHHQRHQHHKVIKKTT